MRVTMSGAHPLPVTSGATAVALCITYLAALIAWMLSGAPGDRTLIADLAPLPLWLAAGLLAVRAARHRELERRTARAWRVLAAAFLTYGLGDALWAYFELVGGVEPFPSLADGPYLLFYPLVLWGLLSFPMTVRSRADGARFWMDAATVLLGGAMVVWYTVMRPALEAKPSGMLAAALTIAYPAGDLVVSVGLTAVVLRRPHARSRWPLTLLAGAMLLMVAGDIAFGSAALQEGYQPGSWPDAVWMAAATALAVAAVLQHAHAGRTDTAHARDGGRAVALLPYVSLVVGYAVLLVAERERLAEPEGMLLLSAVALTAMVAVRQMAATREVVRLQAERAARAGEARFRSLVQHSSDLILVSGADGAVTFASPSAWRVMGREPEDLLGRNLLALVHHEDTPRAAAYLRAAAAFSGAAEPAAWRMLHQDGSWQHVEVVAANLLADEHVRGVVLTARDVGERMALEAQLVHRAFHDPLTGLPNRALFADRVAQALLRARRTGRLVAVVFLDLDGFKTVNDSLGHAAGDRLLADAARRLAQQVRPGDTVSRFGGDEYAALLDDPPSTAEACAVAGRLIEALRAPFELDGKEVYVSGSAGVVCVAHGSQDADGLLRDADVAMYHAKARGKGRWELFEPGMHTAAVERLTLQADLQRALERQELRVHYQPSVDLGSGQITGVEALIRWQHPERGLIAPAQFVPLAEESGLIVPIGAWVLAESCRQWRAWTDAYPDRQPLTVSVNVSARQLAASGFTESVERLLAEVGMRPSYLVLEITESSLMHDVDAVSERLHMLRRLGVRIAVDDFGTGYNSLTYLQRLPVDILKIDKSFVDAITEDPEKAALAGAIIGLGESLRLETLAEGIERPEQLAGLRTLGCQSGQGFIFSRAVVANEVAVMLSQETEAGRGAA